MSLENRMQNNHNRLYSRGQSGHLKTNDKQIQPKGFMLKLCRIFTLSGYRPLRASIPFVLIPEVTSCDTPNVCQPLFLALTLQCSPMSEGLDIYRVTS